ncbi:RNA methyltransferase, TrmH family [Amycolatopsis arida]|uniref:RNA methyltransferase, TrmH family n=1 Tax=Amycolatopsis arida TaxID=587909 RepID=A0A1I5ZBR3_9PSEU|nr:SpoU rRNA methylase family protein [Amycolatopsis arida]SFQ53936.1 RNA methyltransferase, TrmH family [Amycolatopsis arida]
MLQAARGTALTTRVRRYPTPARAVAGLRDAGFQVVATSPRGRHVQSLAPLRGDRLALVVGNETHGVDEETLAATDLVVRIPMAGPVESLNVGVAAGIGIYELRMRMVLAMLTDRIRATLGRDLGVTARFVRAAFDARLAADELDATQVVALMIVACDRRTPVDELTRELGLTGDERAGALDPLVDRGYLARTGPDVAITDAGEHAVAALWTVVDGIEAELYAGLSTEERTEFRRMLRRIQENALRLGRGVRGTPHTG